MRKLLLVSILVIVAGLGMILYTDPVISGSGSPTSKQIDSITNGTAIAPPGGADCTTQTSGGVDCTGGVGPVSTSQGDSVIVTIAGIALCGFGLFLAAIESLLRPISQAGPKIVT